MTVIEKALSWAAAAVGLVLLLALIQFLLFPASDYADAAAKAQAETASLQEQTAKYEAQIAEDAASGANALKDARTQNQQLTAEHDRLTAEKEEKTAKLSELETSIAGIDTLPEDIVTLRTQYGEKIRELEDMVNAGTTDVKICYLTFDDGPTNITHSFLDKLDELGINATFFTIGANTSQNQEENLRREMMAGHTIANHTFSHAYNTGVYSSLEELMKQVQLQDDKVFEATGFHTDIFRFPSGSYYCPFRDDAIKALQEAGFGWIDWSANAYDAGVNAGTKTPAEISGNMVYECKTLKICVMLCHDWNSSTLAALDTAVPKLQEAGYVFLPLLPQSSTLGNTESNFG